MGHDLEAVADAQHGHTRLENPLIDSWRPVHVDGGRSAGEDDRLGILGQHLVQAHRMRHQLGVDPCLPDSTSDQLGVLRTEIDHQDGTLCHKTPYIYTYAVSAMDARERRFNAREQVQYGCSFRQCYRS